MFMNFDLYLWHIQINEIWRQKSFINDFKVSMFSKLKEEQHDQQTWNCKKDLYHCNQWLSIINKINLKAHLILHVRNGWQS